MAHTGIFATKAECDSMAGENVDTTGWTEANINAWCAMSESRINVESNYNWSDAYASLNADVKSILSHASSCFVAMHGISYNIDGYSKVVVAQTMINLLYQMFKEDCALLSKAANVDYVRGA